MAGNSIERVLQPVYGARFFRHDGKDMFEHRIDARAAIGPRIATRIDKENHPKLWDEYQQVLTEELEAAIGGKKQKQKVK